jgi:hypothetical protein
LRTLNASSKVRFIGLSTNIQVQPDTSNNGELAIAAILSIRSQGMETQFHITFSCRTLMLPENPLHPVPEDLRSRPKGHSVMESKELAADRVRRRKCSLPTTPRSFEPVTSRMTSARASAFRGTRFGV